MCFSKYTVVEKTSAEQETEVTEPSEEISDEGNSEDEGDDISNEDSEDEELVEEEPSEGDVEDDGTPADEADAEEGDANEAEDDLMSIQPNAVGANAVKAPEEGNFDYTPGENSDVATNGFTFTVTAKDGYKITAVQYQVTGGEATDADEGSADNTYIIPAEVFANAEEGAEIRIIVTAVALETYTITYAPADNAKIAKLEYLVGTEYETYNEETQMTVTENQDFKFKLTAETFYKVAEVKAGTTTLTADKDGVYTIEKVTAATTIAVTTDLDEKQCNSVTVTLDTASDARSATATLTVKNQLETIEMNAEVGTAVLVPGEDVLVNITPKNGYKITKVNKKDVTPDEDDKVTQEVTFSNKKATVTVTTEAKASESENTITFANSTRHMTYKVTGDKKVTPVAGQTDTYQSAAGSQRLQFTVTANGSYKPTVKQSSSKEDEAEVTLTASKTTATKTGATYDYVVPTSLFEKGADYTFTITEEEDNRKFTLSGNLADVQISASKDGQKITLTNGTDDDGAAILTYPTLLNDTVAFQISAKDGAILKAVTSQVGENGKATAAKITNGVANVEIKATDDVTIKIETDDQYTASALMNEDGSKVSITDPKKNVYGVSYNGKYKASVTKGAATPTNVVLSEIKVLDGKNEVKPKDAGAPFTSITGDNNNVASIDLSKADGVEGRTLTLELYTTVVTGDEAKSEKVASYTMAVSVAANDIKIDKKADAAATQTIDTTKTYTVTAAKGVDLSKLVATVEDDNGIIATEAADVNDGDGGEDGDGNDNGDLSRAAGDKLVEYKDGKLTVTLAAAKGLTDKTAKITIAEEGAVADAPKATLTITAADLITSSTKAPTVKMVAATDVSFKLTLSAKTEQAENGKLYYKVTTQKASESESGNSITTYVEKKNDSQTAEVMVTNGSYGSGEEASYTVKASLVHASEAVTNIHTLADDKNLGESQASKSQTLKTQTPAYEDKLKLKKINATVITGQQNVEIAEPQFSKYTTYLSLADNAAVQDISYPDWGTLNVAVNGQGKIIASATEDTAIGKHKIKVTAAAANGAYASVATIDITVVRGIHDLRVDVPSTNLYKAAKKPAKVKATVVYNEDVYSNSVPKNKKVTWDIVDADENELAENSYLKKMVSVKNGTVTVDKNFIIDPENDAQHTFVIKVTADNSKTFAGKESDGSDVVGYSDPITITATGEDIKKIVIKQGDDTKASPTGTKDPCKVHASDINWGEVVVLDSNDNEIDLSLLTLKSSNQKSVAVDAEGQIEVNKVGKVKLTATAKDGSNNKAELSLDIINDETDGKDLSLEIVPAHYEYDEWSSWAEVDADGWNDDKVIYNPSKPNGKEISNLTYDASTTPLVAVQVQQKGTDDEWYSEAPDFANIKLSVSGGKIVEQWGNMTYIAVNAQKATIKLTDASQKPAVTKEFVLNSTGASTKPAFKALNKLHSQGTVEEQTADIEVTKLPADIPTTDLVAKVEVDWSAKNTKNEYDLYDFAGMLKDYYPVTITDNKGSFTLNFDSKEEKIYLNQKSYKLTVTLGTQTTTGEGDEEVTTFTAKTLPTSMTVSVDSAKKFTFKPTTSYTLTTKDAKAGALLTGKASITDYDVEWDTTLQNLNTKGVTNSFTKYFEVVNGTIQLKTGETFPTNKADCTGYITYTATATSNYYNVKEISDTVKITVKLDEKKTVKKYAQKKDEAATIVKTVGSKATVTIDATEGKNSAAADLAYVIVDPKDSNKGFAAALPTSDGDNTGKVELTWNGESDLKAGKKLTVKLLVVPTSSYYTALIANAADDAARNELIKTYGISTSVKVTVVETATVEPETKITVTVSAASDSVVAGSEQKVQCTAVAKDGETKIEGATFNWSVKAKDNSTLDGGTSINSTTGELTIAAAQEAVVLIVTATYTPDEGEAVTGTTEVTVTAAAGGEEIE